ncbi:MAG TPA: DUF2332 domain-containing protein [Acidimicrobiia bacterium]|nr:DUF2332 domain-containing protein [Acidimicrobiia bacterium]
MRETTPGDVLEWRRHAGDSPLYERLAHVIADDPELMRVLNEIEHDPAPNILLAGVQFLLMSDPTDDLARFYPNLVERPERASAVDPVFRQFVLDHEHQLVDIGRTRHTQTNEVRRCAALLPAIWETPATEFHLVDVGTSAGLNLVMDRYRYDWDGLEWGPSSPVTLECSVRGRPPRPRPITIMSRTGLDLSPLDPAEHDDRMWLEALIWPEQTTRRRRLQAALEVQSGETVHLVAGDAVDTFGTTLEQLPDGPVIAMHSVALNQFEADQRSALDEQIDAARSGRPVWRVSMELLDWRDDAPTISIDDGSGPTVIGQGHPHGEWVELYALP